VGEEPKLKRPRGVTILAILSILTGAYVIFFTAGFFATSTSFEALFEISSIEEGRGVYAFFGSLMLIAVGGALFSGKSWARTLVIIMSIISIISIVGLYLLQIANPGYYEIILDAIVLWYLRKPHVKAFFNQKTMQE